MRDLDRLPTREDAARAIEVLASAGIEQVFEMQLQVLRDRSWPSWYALEARGILVLAAEVVELRERCAAPSSVVAEFEALSAEVERLQRELAHERRDLANVRLDLQRAKELDRKRRAKIADLAARLAQAKDSGGAR